MSNPLQAVVVDDIVLEAGIDPLQSSLGPLPGRCGKVEG
jgi:hypothetical protein